MKRVLVITAIIFAVQVSAFAQPQDKGKRPDPKEMTARAAKHLDFSEDQVKKLDDLNKKHEGDDYDKKKYRDEFREIMTDEQKQKADEMRKQRGERGGPRHQNIRK